MQTLSSFPGDPRVSKLLVAAKYVGLELHVPLLAYPDFTQAPEWQESHVMGKLPVLDTPQGSVFQTNAIMRYIGRQGKGHNLYGANIFEATQIDSWIDWTNDVDLPAAAWLYPLWGLEKADVATRDMAASDLQALLAKLDKYLAPRTYLVSEQVTLADIAVTFSLLELYKQVFDAEFREPYVNVNRWFLTIVNQPNVLEVIGETKLCEKMPGAPLPRRSSEATSESSEKASIGEVLEPTESTSTPPAGDEEGVSTAVDSVQPDAQPEASATPAQGEAPAAAQAGSTPAATPSSQPTSRKTSVQDLAAEVASDEESAEIYNGVSLKPFTGAKSEEFEAKIGGPEGGGFPGLGLFGGKKGAAAKEIWLQINEIRGKLTEEHLQGLVQLLRAERYSLSKKKTTAYFLFQDHQAADQIAAMKPLTLYLTQ